MNTQQASRRCRDLEFASFIALVRVLLDSENFFQAQSIIPVLARTLNIGDETAFQVMQRCLDEKRLVVTAEMTRNFDALDAKMIDVPAVQSMQDETSQFTTTMATSCPMELSQQLFDDLLGNLNIWPRFMQLIEGGGARQDFVDIRQSLIKAAEKLRQQVALE